MPRARRSPSPSPVALAVAVAALLAVTSLAGCGSGDSPEAGATPAASSTPAGDPAPSPAEATAGSTAASPTSSASQPPKRPRARNTPAGREAFARHVIAAWSYALRTNDAAAVVRLGPKRPPCEGCRALQAELARRKRQGWFVNFPGVEVRRVTLAPAGAPDTVDATARVSVPASRSYFDDGSYRNDNEAHPRATFTVRMRWQKGGFVLLAFELR